MIRLGLLLSCGLLAVVASAQRVDAVFDQNCASCHEMGNAAKSAKAPDRKAIHKLTPEAVYESITNGSMKDRAQSISGAQKRAIAEYIGGRKLGTVEAGDAKVDAEPLLRESSPRRCLRSPRVERLGRGHRKHALSTRQVCRNLHRSNLVRLKLKWAFGFPGARAVNSQPPAIAGRTCVHTGGNRICVCLGCSHRMRLLVVSRRRRDAQRHQRWQAARLRKIRSSTSANTKANAYALDAATGQLIWKVSVDDHWCIAHYGRAPALRGPAVRAGGGVFGGSHRCAPHYPCCTFRGSVVALDAATGRQIWKAYTIPEPPHPTGQELARRTTLGPGAGGGVWSAPDHRTHSVTRSMWAPATGSRSRRRKPPTPLSPSIWTRAKCFGRRRIFRGEDAFVEECTPGVFNFLELPQGRRPRIGPFSARRRFSKKLANGKASWWPGRRAEMCGRTIRTAREPWSGILSLFDLLRAPEHRGFQIVWAVRPTIRTPTSG